MPSIDDLRTQFKTAQAATEAYSDEITAKAWTDEERAELKRLRDEATRIAVDIDRARQAGEGE